MASPLLQTQLLAIQEPVEGDVAERVEALIDVMDELAALLDEETAAIKRLDVVAAGALKARKTDLADRYEIGTRTLSGDKDELADLDAALKERLTRRSHAFSEALGANLSAIGAARRASQRVMDTIVETARRTAAPKTGYGRSVAAGNGIGYRPALSVKLNGTF